MKTVSRNGFSVTGQLKDNECIALPCAPPTCDPQKWVLNYYFHNGRMCPGCESCIAEDQLEVSAEGSRLHTCVRAHVLCVCVCMRPDVVCMGVCVCSCMCVTVCE